jgi:hypothetical protein
MKDIADCVDPGAGSTWSPRRSTDSPAVPLDPRRCQFSFADGRRCRLPRWEAHPTLCVSHARPEAKPAQTANLADELGPLSGQFNTATDVNHALGNLFSLLAQNRIPRRNAVALGYLAQLLLQTLPGVRAELTQCCGEEAWDETLESIFCEDETEAETEAAADDNTEDEPEDDPLLPVYERDPEPAFERQPPIDEKDAAPAYTEAAHTETELPLAEIAPEPKPEELPEPAEFVAQPPEPYNYWKELEQNEHLRKTRH